MTDYKVSVLHDSDYKTTSWSGGMTTEISIAPEGSVYADRDFKWRLSSATVELEESDFTSLPDYNRIIMTLKGDICLCHNKGRWMEFPEFTPHFFDGKDETSSRGRVVDFNLMMRKGVCTGDAEACRLKEGEEAALSGLLKGGLKSYEQVVFYCYEGDVSVLLEDGRSFSISAGDSLKITGDFKNAHWTVKAKKDASAVLAGVHDC